MKIEALRIEFDWLTRQTGSEIDRVFFAEIGLAAGDEFLTRLDDLGAKTVRDRMRGCAYRLATWLAANWWRLRWEPEPAKRDLDWRIAHTIATAGGGYIWPDATFASDGVFVDVTTLPGNRNSSFEPIRYINSVQARISADDFERKVDEFMEAVLSRLLSCKVKDQDLLALWSEISEERRDPDVSRFRKLEAMAGFEAGEAPEELFVSLLNDPQKLGRSAIEEVASGARHSVGETLNAILKLAPLGNKPKAGGYRVVLPKANLMPAPEANSGMPWKRGAELARRARESWGLGRKPISKKKLAGLLDSSPDIFTEKTIAPTQMPIGFRVEDGNALDIYLDRRPATTRRFAVSRLLGDHLYSHYQEKLIPATQAKTFRQKVQRAFAQEFLCPYDALVEKMQTRQPNDDDISEAAAYFDVSPLTVATTLVNHGELEPDALALVEQLPKEQSF